MEKDGFLLLPLKNVTDETSEINPKSAQAVGQSETVIDNNKSHFLNNIHVLTIPDLVLL